MDQILLTLESLGPPILSKTLSKVPEYEELLMQMSEMVRDPMKAVTLTRGDYFKALDAAINIIPLLSSVEAQAIAKLVSVIDFIANTQRDTKLKPEEVVQKFKSSQEDRVKTASISSRNLEIYLEGPELNDFAFMRREISKALADAESIGIVKKACRKLAERELYFFDKEGSEI